MRITNFIHTLGNRLYGRSIVGPLVNEAKTTNPAGVALIKEFEGCAFRSYQDQGGTWTAGYGHISGVGPGTTCTQELADKWLLEDLCITESVVAHEITEPLTSNQFSALVAFTFNEGAGHLDKSSARKFINAGDYNAGANALLLWDKIRGAVVPGLLRRRQAEVALFMRSPKFIPLV